MESVISWRWLSRTHSGGIRPNAIIPDPSVAGRDREDAWSAALTLFSRISGAAELNATNVTAATSSGMSY